MRFSTVIVLPKSEVIANIASGDASSDPKSSASWHIGQSPGVENTCYVKPIRKGARTDLQILAKSGHSYSFHLIEISKDGTEPDTKVFVKRKDDAPAVKLADACDPRLEKALREETALAETQKSAMTAQISSLQQQVSERVDPQEFLHGSTLYHLSHTLRKAPFNVTKIVEDGSFTYVVSTAPEQPMFYAIRDGKSQMVNFTYKAGVYRIQGVVAEGELKIGKKKASFKHQGS